MKHKQLHIILLALGAVLGALTRFWNLSAALDQQGLFILRHPATSVLIGISILFVLVFAILSQRSPGHGVDHRVLTYGSGQAVLSLIAGLLLLASSVFYAVSNVFDLEVFVLFVLGLGSAISMLVLSMGRKRGNKKHLPELVPVFFLLVKLIFNFKNWSTDPIILDYYDMLFAMIFLLLAVYGIAGFSYDCGCPRRTLFYSSCGIFFSAMAAVDGLMEGTWSNVLLYLAMILWLCPSVYCLLVPREEPPKAAKKAKSR